MQVESAIQAASCERGFDAVGVEGAFVVMEIQGEGRTESVVGKAIILAGGASVLPYPLVLSTPKSMLPILNRPLLETQIETLRANGYRDIGIALTAEALPVVQEHFRAGERFGVRLSYAADRHPSGPAGCLRLFDNFFKDGPVLLVSGTTFLGDVDLRELLAFHAERQAAVTIALSRNMISCPPANEEYASIAPDGTVDTLRVDRPMRRGERQRRFAGIYVVDPGVFGEIPPHGYADIKEQLIPRLRAKGAKVLGFTLEGSYACVDSTANYLEVQRDALSRGIRPTGDYVLRGENAWIAESAQVPDSVRIEGSVVVGPGTCVGEGCHLVGPTVIGGNCVVGQDASLVRTMLWDHAHVGRRSELRDTILGFGYWFPVNRKAEARILMWSSAGRRLKFVRRISDSPLAPERIDAEPGLARRLADCVWRGFKRSLDVTASSVGLVCLSPLLLLIAVAIKLNSKGPVFFTQRRCGRDGREFRMIKFRTMRADAEVLQTQLIAMNNVDGPMFKIFEDPRVTRVGWFLRRNSLDELPQLLNVLKGEMSLVGPRPLKMTEMTCCPGWRDMRLSVRPGITGLWQINGRSNTAFHDWIRHDTQYVRNWSVGMDCRILTKTASWVLKRTGAC